MAFKDVSKAGFAGEIVKAKDLKLGQPLTAFVVRYDQYEHDGKKFNNLIMQKQDGGEQFLLQTCGTLSYAVQDNKIAVGILTQITKTADIGKAVKRTTFEVLQDADVSIDGDVDAKFAALGDADVSPKEEERKASVAKATEQGIKNQAQKLANSVAKRA